jgi:hypothetical protein
VAACWKVILKPRVGKRKTLLDFCFQNVFPGVGLQTKSLGDGLSDFFPGDGENIMTPIT